VRGGRGEGSGCCRYHPGAGTCPDIRCRSGPLENWVRGGVTSEREGNGCVCTCRQRGEKRESALSACAGRWSDVGEGARHS
jgi:hypothetical protein